MKNKTMVSSELEVLIEHHRSKLIAMEPALERLMSIVSQGSDAVAMMLACIVLLSCDIKLDEEIISVEDSRTFSNLSSMLTLSEELSQTAADRVS
jgi:hypothetical protein